MPRVSPRLRSATNRALCISRANDTGRRGTARRVGMAARGKRKRYPDSEGGWIYHPGDGRHSGCSNAGISHVPRQSGAGSRAIARAAARRAKGTVVKTIKGFYQKLFHSVSPDALLSRRTESSAEPADGRYQNRRASRPDRLPRTPSLSTSPIMNATSRSPPARRSARPFRIRSISSSPACRSS
jgi:hypothetical protein